MISVQGALSDLASPSHLHLALAQVLPCDDDPKLGHSLEAGFEKLSTYARRATEEGADVVAFPEYFLAGSSHQSWYGVRERGGPLPLDRHNETSKDQEEQHWLEEVCALARKLDLNIVAGTVVELGPHMKGEKHQVPHRGEVSKSEEDASEAKEPLFNTAYFVGRHGDVRGKYTKRNLWHPEREPLTAGHDSTHSSPSLFTFTTRRGQTLTAGMQICWDLAFPESFRSLSHPSPSNDAAISRPDIIFVPTCWYATDGGPLGMKWNPFGEAALLDSMTLTRSLESECILAMINIAGRDFDQGWREKFAAPTTSWEERKEMARSLAEDENPVGVGRTTVVSPFLGSIARIDGPEEKLLLASVDLNILKDIRETYKIREDLM